MRLFFLLSLILIGHLAWAQSAAIQKLRTGNDSLLTYQTYYAEASLKDPTNTGARRIQQKLASTTQKIDSYLAGTASRKDVATAVSAAKEEARRYRSETAKRLFAHLEGIQGFVNELPKEYSPETGATEPEPEASTEPSEPASPLVRRSEPVYGQQISPEAGSSYYLFAFSLGLILLLGAYLIYQQRRMAQQFMTRLTDLEVYAGFPKEGTSNTLGNQRLEEIERLLTENHGQLDARLIKQEQQLGTLRREHSELAENLYGTALLQKRLEALENLLKTDVETAPELITAEYAVHGNGSHPSAKHLSTPTLTVPAEEELEAQEMPSQNLSGDRLPILQILAEWQLQTSLPRLAEAAHQLSAQLRSLPATEKPEPALLAEVLQLGYVSAYNDSSLPHYLQLKAFAEKQQYIIEDELAGRMAFSEHYADNLTYETYFGLYNGHAKNLPNLTAQRDTLWENENDPSILSRTVLRVLQPAVVVQKEGAKQVVRRGTYLVKS